MASHLSEPDDQPALVQGLQDGMEATAALVSRLIQDRGGFDARDQLLMECQSAQSEVKHILPADKSGTDA